MNPRKKGRKYSDVHVGDCFQEMIYQLASKSSIFPNYGDNGECESHRSQESLCTEETGKR